MLKFEFQRDRSLVWALLRCFQS